MINLQNISKSFIGLFRPVLDGLDLKIKSGEFCVLIGANGCGKSTLLKLISGEYIPDGGLLKVKGKVSQVVQDVNMGTIPEMTLLENMAFGCFENPNLLFYSRYTASIIEKIKELNIGLESQIHQPIKFLSGGQRQMIATLMAIHSGGKILLLDEHTSALDPKMQNLLMEYTNQQVINLGLSCLMITHKMEDAIKYGNRLIMLHNGKIIFDAQGPQKKSLEVNDLVKIFHKYQDEIL